MTKDEVLDGFNFAEPCDKDNLLKWIADPTMGAQRKKALLIIGPKASGKSTLARRLQEYFGEEPMVHHTGPTSFFPASRSRAFRELCESLEKKAIVVSEHVRPEINYHVLNRVVELVRGRVIKVRALRSYTKLDEYTAKARIVVSAHSVAKNSEDDLRYYQDESKDIAVVRLAERGARTN